MRTNQTPPFFFITCLMYWEVEYSNKWFNNSNQWVLPTRSRLANSINIAVPLVQPRWFLTTINFSCSFFTSIVYLSQFEDVFHGIFIITGEHRFIVTVGWDFRHLPGISWTVLGELRSYIRERPWSHEGNEGDLNMCHQILLPRPARRRGLKK